jgi:hypothetical protein
MFKNIFEKLGKKMAKSLSQRIAERSLKKAPSRNAQNRATFLAIRSDIKQALDDGWPIKSIWELLHEEKKINFSYQAFRGYVNRLLLSQGTSNTEIFSENLLGVTATDQVKMSDKKLQKIKNIPGFKFNSIPKKEELL